jgi:cold shock CspA family protein
MRFAGRLTEWHDEKGYGFVVPNGGGERVFVHVKKFERLRRRPVEGELLSYEVSRDDTGRLAAMRVRMTGQTAAAHEQRQGARRIPHTFLGLVAIAAIAFAAWRGWLPIPASSSTAS